MKYKVTKLGLWLKGSSYKKGRTVSESDIGDPSLVAKLLENGNIIEPSKSSQEPKKGAAGEQETEQKESAGEKPDNEPVLSDDKLTKEQ